MQLDMCLKNNVIYNVDDYVPDTLLSYSHIILSTTLYVIYEGNDEK